MPHESWTLLESRYLKSYRVMRLREDRYYRFRQKKVSGTVFQLVDAMGWLVAAEKRFLTPFSLSRP